ncbi:MAG: formyltransferase family protein [Acidimicrobiales bacterium]
MDADPRSSTFVGPSEWSCPGPARPSFPGAHAIDEAFAAWEAGEITESGVMIHWVPDAGVDEGPGVHAVVPFEAGDTLETFAGAHTVEHRAIVEAIDLALDRGAPPHRTTQVFRGAEALTFDDLLVVPGWSEVLPTPVDTSTGSAT